MRRITALLPVLALSGCALWALSTKRVGWPEHDGELVVEGISEAILIERDAYGIPHITAQTDDDAWFGLGYVHGQDRLFQCDANRRLSFGGLSPWAGDRTVELDAFVQGLGIRQRAVAAVRRMSPQARSGLEAYTRGLNAGASSRRKLPTEYRVLGIDWEPWAPSDSYGMPHLMAWFLAENASTELFALSLRDRLDRERLDALLRADPRTPPVDLFWNQIQTVQLGPWTPQFAAFDANMGTGQSAASNNWALAGSRTANGAALLANDPHLVQMVPSLWYAAEVTGETLHVAGMTLPGSPGVIIGHNEHVGWGLTNVMADTVDLAVVERHGASGYIHKGDPKAFVEREVVVATKGAPERRTLLWTEIGPVLSSIDATHVLVLRWAALETDDETFDLYEDLMRAESVAEAIEAIDRPSVAAQNFVLADDQGHIGWTVGGSLVRRRGMTGRIPYPAWHDDYGWQGWIDRRPGEIDPERGYIVTANNRPDQPGVDAISTNYMPSWRAERIAERIEATNKHQWATVAGMQLDVYDTHAASLAPRLLEGVVPSTPEATLCHGLLTGWDYQATAESPGEAVWAVFQRELLIEALEDDIGPEATKRYLSLARPGQTLLDGQLDVFLPDRAQGADRALHSSCVWLSRELGSRSESWQWGDLHPLTLEHPFGQVLKGWNLPRTPMPGSPNSIRAASYHLGEDLSTTSMPSMRMVMPMDDLSSSTLSNPGGQSGHPGHAQYDSMYRAHVEGVQVPLWFGQAASEHAESTLVLTPQ